jgi:hypothetical protein
VFGFFWAFARYEFKMVITSFADSKTAMSKTGKSKSYQWFPAMAKARNHSYSIESGAPEG